MRILMLHNRYRQPGGEDAVVRRECELLEERGIEVILHEVSNSVSGDGGALATIDLIAQSAWSRDSYDEVRQLCAQYRPNIVHTHNFWMKLSPSVHAACRDSGAATVQTIHNYRLLCVNALFLRNGKACEDCLGKAPWRGVVRRCHQNSLLASAAVARMIASNRRWRTWQEEVDAFITPSRHVRSKLIAGGFPAERIRVKPNFAMDPGPTPFEPSHSRSAVFVGRLSEEKGLDLLLRAWAGMKKHDRRTLIIAGDGPARQQLENRAAALGLGPAQVVFAGQQQPENVKKLLMSARFVLLPSLCGESFGNSVVEAFSCGRPAIVTDLGGQAELVEHGVHGWKVPAGDPQALSAVLDNCFSCDGAVDRAGKNARHEFVSRYTPERNFETLMDIYESVSAGPLGVRELEGASV